MTDHTRTNPRTGDPTPRVLDHLDLQIAAGSDEIVHPEGACDR